MVNQEALRFNKLLLRVRASLVDIGRLSERLLEFTIVPLDRHADMYIPPHGAVGLKTT